jgi:hypothetical protein
VSAAQVRTWAALALQVAALVAASLALLGVSWLDARAKPRWLVLVDRSESVRAAPPTRRPTPSLAPSLRLAARRCGSISPAGRAAPAPASSAAVAALHPRSTDIEAALQAALALHADAALAGAVVVSDGQENVGDAARALRAAREAQPADPAGSAVFAPAPSTRVAHVLAPDASARRPAASRSRGAPRRRRRSPTCASKATAAQTGRRRRAGPPPPHGVEKGRATVGVEARRSGAPSSSTSPFPQIPASGATIGRRGRCPAVRRFFPAPPPGPRSSTRAGRAGP